jgi:hypothetical protein
MAVVPQWAFDQSMCTFAEGFQAIPASLSQAVMLCQFVFFPDSASFLPKY